MRRKKTFETFVAFFVAASLSVGATALDEQATAQDHKKPVVIHTDPGGSLYEFIGQYELDRQQHRLVKVDGLCISACTLVVGLIPPANLCATPFGQFAFHSAFTIDDEGKHHFSQEATRLAWHIYPKKVQQLLQNRFGWDGDADKPHPTLMYVQGTDLVRACGENE